jgi:NADPH oxidase 2
MVNDAGAPVDAITGLKAPTNFGRPNWDRVFRGVRQLHEATDVGVFFCGPKPLGHTLHLKCNEWSQPGPNGTRFTFGKARLRPKLMLTLGKFLMHLGYRREYLF